MIESIPYVLTGIGIIASILYYTSVLRNANKTRELQLKAQEHATETRQAQLFMQFYNKASTKEYMAIENNLIDWEFNNPQDFLEKYGPVTNPEAFSDFTTWLSLWEGMGILVREGLLNIRLMALSSTGDIMITWEKYEDVVYELRRMYEWPRYSIELEYLYQEIKKYAETHPELQILNTL